MSQDQLDARRHEILAAARGCFARFGYEGATVRRLEDATGLSRGAIFHHFRDKDSLFLAVAEDDAAAMVQTVADNGLVQVMRDLLAQARSSDGDTAGWLGSQLEVSRRLRTDPDSPNPYIPVIMMTGHTDRAKVMQARDAGVTEFLVKPISSRLLCQRLQAVIDRPRPFVRAKSFFGPDRRRRSSLDFGGEERRSAQPGEMAALSSATAVDKLLETL